MTHVPRRIALLCLAFLLVPVEQSYSQVDLADPPDTSAVPTPEQLTQKPMTSAQFAAIDALPGFEEVWLDHEGIPSYLKANLGVFSESTAVADAGNLLTLLAIALKADGTETLVLRNSSVDDVGRLHYRLDQRIDGLQVIGGEAVLHVVSGAVYAMDAQFLPATNLLARAPLVPSGLAWTIGRNSVKEYCDRFVRPVLGGDVRFDCLVSTLDATASDPELAFYRDPLAAGYLVWSIMVVYSTSDGPQVDDVLVDAITGAVVGRLPQVNAARFREVLNAGGDTNDQNDVLVMSEGGATTDPDVQAAYDYSGATYNLYFNAFSRDAWNGSGGHMLSRVHVGVRYNNAYWQSGSTHFGDGDGSLFSPLDRALDVVAHEFTHGVTQTTANLAYSGESGALNEAMSDIFGAATEASVRGVSANTWNVGEDVYTPGTVGDALRYMNNPTQDCCRYSDPLLYSRDYYPERYTGSTDNGGVHFNSGIANLAFYLLVNGGHHPRSKTSVTVSGVGLPTARRIFYIALSTRLTSSDNFSKVRDKTAQVAIDYQVAIDADTGRNSVCQAWNAVGVPAAVPNCKPPPDDPPVPRDREECYRGQPDQNYYNRTHCP